MHIFACEYDRAYVYTLAQLDTPVKADQTVRLSVCLMMPSARVRIDSTIIYVGTAHTRVADYFPNLCTTDGKRIKYARMNCMCIRI